MVAFVSPGLFVKGIHCETKLLHVVDPCWLSAVEQVSQKWI